MSREVDADVAKRFVVTDDDIDIVQVLPKGEEIPVDDKTKKEG